MWNHHVNRQVGNKLQKLTWSFSLGVNNQSWGLLLPLYPIGALVTGLFSNHSASGPPQSRSSFCKAKQSGYLHCNRRSWNKVGHSHILPVKPAYCKGQTCLFALTGQFCTSQDSSAELDLWLVRLETEVFNICWSRQNNECQESSIEHIPFLSAGTSTV